MCAQNDLLDPRRRRLTTVFALLAATAVPASGAIAQEQQNQQQPNQQLQNQQQQKDFVVTATRTPTPLGQVGSSVTVITRQDIERRQSAFVHDVLRTVPGVVVNRSGGISSFTEVRIRGSEANQVLVLIDGIEVSDVAFGSQFDFGSLTTDQIERIEIIRGAHSTVYGSEAIGGVIQIFTKKGRKGLQIAGGGEIGSFTTTKVHGSVSGAGKKYNFAAGASLLNTDGISIADDRLGFTELDGYRNLTATANGTVKPTDWLDLTGVFRYTKTRTEVDFGFQPGFNIADDDSEGLLTQYFAKAEARLKLLKGKWDQYFRYSWARTINTNLTPGKLESFVSNSNRHKFGTQGIVRPFKDHVLTIGLEREIERARFTNGPGQLVQSIFIDGVYAQYQIGLLKRFYLTGGLRFDNHELFGVQDSYRIAGVYDLKETQTKFKASFGTGFKSPTIGELFLSNATFLIVANPNLSPEFSRTWDIGVEQSFWKRRGKATVTYFSSDVFDLIQNTPIGGGQLQPQNIGRADIQGVEVEGTLRPLEGLFLKATYTWLLTQDQATGSNLLRRPKHVASFTINYTPPWLKKLNVNLGIDYRGTSEDLSFATFPASRVGLPSAIVVNLAASYRITKEVQVFGRITNINDAKYQTLAGAGTPGRAFFIGVRANLSVLD